MITGLAEADGAAFEAAIAGDREFFARNPDRDIYIRAAVDGELLGAPACPPGWRWWTIVRQLSPGARLRFCIALEGEPARGNHAVSQLLARSFGVPAR